MRDSSSELGYLKELIVPPGMVATSAAAALDTVPSLTFWYDSLKTRYYHYYYKIQNYERDFTLDSYTGFNVSS